MVHRNADEKAEIEAYRTLGATLQELMGHYGWDAYCQQLEKVEKELIERLVGSRGSQGTASDDVLKGKIEGLREAAHMPALIVSRAKGMSNG